MRVLFIRQNYPPERGPFRYIYNLATDLATKGHEITVITGLPHYPEGKPYKGFGKYRPLKRSEAGVTVIRLPLIMASNRQPAKRIIGFIAFALSIWPVLFFCKKPDAIVCSIPPVTAIFPALSASVIRRIPLVAMLHDFEPLRSLELRDKIGKPFVRQVIRLFVEIYGTARNVVVPVEDKYRALVRHGLNRNRIKIIPHGIDVNRFRELACLEIPFRLPRCDNRKIALYLGTIGMAHDIESLVRAFADSEIRMLPVDLVIVGDGECAPICQTIIRTKALSNVKILSPVELQWVPNILCQADILIMSQKPRPFSFGSKFCEYLASGKPIMVNSTGILAKTVQEIGNGWIFNVQVKGSLKQPLVEFLSLSKSQLEDMGAKGLKYADSNLNSKNFHGAWEELLRSIINNGRPA